MLRPPRARAGPGASPRPLPGSPRSDPPSARLRRRARARRRARRSRRLRRLRSRSLTDPISPSRATTRSAPMAPRTHASAGRLRHPAPFEPVRASCGHLLEQRVDLDEDVPDRLRRWLAVATVSVEGYRRHGATAVTRVKGHGAARPSRVGAIPDVAPPIPASATARVAERRVDFAPRLTRRNGAATVSADPATAVPAGRWEHSQARAKHVNQTEPEKTSDESVLHGGLRAMPRGHDGSCWSVLRWRTGPPRHER